jgi:hypothetical protein
VRYTLRATVVDVRDPNQLARHRLQPMAPDLSARLLQAVDELHALERERRSAGVATARWHEVSRRVEAKAREVFRLTETPDTDAPGLRG